MTPKDYVTRDERVPPEVEWIGLALIYGIGGAIAGGCAVYLWMTLGG